MDHGIKYVFYSNNTCIAMTIFKDYNSGEGDLLTLLYSKKVNS